MSISLPQILPCGTSVNETEWMRYKRKVISDMSVLSIALQLSYRRNLVLLSYTLTLVQ